MKNIKYILLLSVFFLFTFSCSKFEEMNTDPNSVTAVSPDMLATQILKNTFRFWNPNPTDFGTGNLFNKHVAILETNPNPYQYYYSYWPYGSFGGYKNWTDLQKMADFAEGTPQESSYKGLQYFLKAWTGWRTSLDMGDVPYSEAGKADEGITKPKYDKQIDVFAQVLDDLKTAESYFAEGATFYGDIMYNGDPTKWRKLCNAVQLKVIQTMSKKVTAADKTRFAEIVNSGNLMTSNADDLKLVFSTNTNASYPFYNGEDRRVYIGVSKLAVDFLKSVNDRRLFYFAEPAQSKINDGYLESDYDAYVGVPTELSPLQLAVDRSNGVYSLLNKRYPLHTDGDPMLYFTYAEQCFIIAEGIEEGWVSGNAQQYYENGVKAMLSYYKDLAYTSGNVHGMAITQTYIDNYFTGNAAYATGGTKTDRLHQIWMQRWIIDFFQGNGGNYPQFLRTGYPLYPLDPSTSMNPEDPNVYPKRWMYPTDEITVNTENYQNAVNDQYGGYDAINAVPWYLQP